MIRFHKIYISKILCVIVCVLSVFLIGLSLRVIFTGHNMNKESEDTPDYALTSVIFDNQREDLGQIISDTIVSRTYCVKNIGTDTLHVLFISPDCNCTGYKFSDNKAAPGDSLTLRIDIDMRNKHLGMFMLNTVVGLNTKEHLYGICITGEVI